MGSAFELSSSEPGSSVERTDALAFAPGGSDYSSTCTATARPMRSLIHSTTLTASAVSFHGNGTQWPPTAMTHECASESRLIRISSSPSPARLAFIVHLPGAVLLQHLSYCDTAAPSA